MDLQIQKKNSFSYWKQNNSILKNPWSRGKKIDGTESPIFDQAKQFLYDVEQTKNTQQGMIYGVSHAALRWKTYGRFW